MDPQVLKRLLTRFHETFESDSLQLSRAPGRVNLIGEHTDYNGGFVMPMAVDREICLLFRPRREGPVRLWSENYGEWDEFDLNDPASHPDQPWSNYVRGVAWSLQEAGKRTRPIEGLVFGDIPIGAGLSSSAALEVAGALALSPTMPATREERTELAFLCQKAENEFVGVNCGIMDQFISLHARRDRAVLLDCRSLDSDQLPLNTDRVRVVVCNTMVDHELGSSAYNQRRATCEEAARTIDSALGDVEQLRDVTMPMLQQCRELLDPLTYRRARHVVTENERATAARQALQNGNYEEFGQLMNDSHRSLKEDYEVSCKELDLMVELARRQPATLGARMTGAGFGGCTVNLVQSRQVDSFCENVREAYRQETGIEADIYEFKAEKGARIETP